MTATAIPAPPRVMQILPCLSAGGAETMVAELAIALARGSMAKVHVATFFPSRPSLPSRLAAAGVSCEDLAKRRGPDPSVIPRLARSIARFQPDLLHTHQYVLPYVAPLLLRHPSLRCFHTIHTLPHNETSFSGRLLQQLLFRGRVHPVAINDVVCSLARAEYHLGRVSTIPNGIDLAPFLHPMPAVQWRKRNNIPASALVITCLAHLRPEKDHAFLLRTFPAIARQVPEGILLLVGDGPLLEPLRALAASLGLGDSIRFLGFRDDIPDILAASDLGVLTSRYEGMPISVLQMMASSLPVVATAVGGLPSLVRQGVTGALVPHGDQAALALALQRLAADPSERARLGENARRRAFSEFSAESMAAAYARLYIPPI